MLFVSGGVDLEPMVLRRIAHVAALRSGRASPHSQALDGYSTPFTTTVAGRICTELSVS